jgi:hypothetical protein
MAMLLMRLRVHPIPYARYLIGVWGRRPQGQLPLQMKLQPRGWAPRGYKSDYSERLGAYWNIYAGTRQRSAMGKHYKLMTSSQFSKDGCPDKQYYT